jgi:DnaJ-class molecular chaperone
MEESLLGILFFCSIVLGLWLGCRDVREKAARERGLTCPTCKGSGRFRSGQWGGFWDTCIRCGGKGVL